MNSHTGIEQQREIPWCSIGRCWREPNLSRSNLERLKNYAAIERAQRWRGIIRKTMDMRMQSRNQSLKEAGSQGHLEIEEFDKIRFRQNELLSERGTLADTASFVTVTFGLLIRIRQRTVVDRIHSLNRSETSLGIQLMFNHAIQMRDEQRHCENRILEQTSVHSFPVQDHLSSKHIQTMGKVNGVLVAILTQFTFYFLDSADAAEGWVVFSNRQKTVPCAQSADGLSISPPVKLN